MLETFTNILSSTVTGALAYIGAGAVAGALIFSVWLGIRYGIRALRTVSEDVDPEYAERYSFGLKIGFDQDEADMYARGEAFSNPDRGTHYRP